VTVPVPELLARLRAGDESALGNLVQVLYEELHRIAAGKLRAERVGHTLQTTALVNEVYLKLIGEGQRNYADRGHFLSVAARVMRQAIEWASSLDVEGQVAAQRVELLDLDRVLHELAAEDQSLASLIEMRYFGGMTAEESAAVLGKSVHVVRHDLRLAQAWLRRKLRR
jgi:RNA polymerase sigma-70 factor, ECF subfamily